MARRAVVVVLAAVAAALGLVLVLARPVAGPGPSGSPLTSPASTPPAVRASDPAATPPVGASPSPTTSNVPTAATPTPATGAPTPATGTPTPAGTPTPGAAPTASPGLIAIDPSLLGILPAAVGGSPVTRDTARETDAAGDAALAASARSLVAAVVGDSGENIATAIIVERRPDVGMAAWFEAYRSDFDAAACDALGGLGGTSTQTVAGRQAQVTTCASGGTVYHVIVRGGTTILSIFEIGPLEFGRLLLENLAPGA